MTHKHNTYTCAREQAVVIILFHELYNQDKPVSVQIIFHIMRTIHLIQRKLTLIRLD